MMTRLQPIRWNMWNLLPNWIGRSHGGRAIEPETRFTVVRLIEVPCRPPATPIERQLVAALKKVGPVSFASLVKRIAADLYTEELRKGAGLLDIGLYGDRLFHQEVVRELTEADGILWEIKPNVANE